MLSFDCVDFDDAFDSREPPLLCLLTKREDLRGVEANDGRTA